MLSRRKFLLVTSLGLPLIGWGLWKATDYDELVVRTLQRRLGYLKLDPLGLQEFAKDFREHFSKSSFRTASVSIVSLLAGVLSFGDSLDERLTKFEELLCDRYLRGSDFFINGEDESRVVRYVSFADPYLRPCANPFARIS